LPSHSGVHSDWATRGSTGLGAESDIYNCLAVVLKRLVDRAEKGEVSHRQREVSWSSQGGAVSVQS